MSNSNDNFSTSSDYSSSYGSTGYEQEYDKSEYDANASYEQPDIADTSEVHVSWSTVDYGGSTVDDALF